MVDVDELAAKILSRFGRVYQASELLSKLDRPWISPCRRIAFLFAQADLWLVAREADAAAAPQGGRAAGAARWKAGAVLRDRSWAAAVR